MSIPPTDLSSVVHLPLKSSGRLHGACGARLDDVAKPESVTCEQCLLLFGAPGDEAGAYTPAIRDALARISVIGRTDTVKRLTGGPSNPSKGDAWRLLEQACAAGAVGAVYGDDADVGRPYRLARQMDSLRVSVRHVVAMIREDAAASLATAEALNRCLATLHGGQLPTP